MDNVLEKSPLIGASIAPGVKSLESFVELKLGNVVLSTLPDDENEALQVAEYCRQNGIYFMLAEIVHRHNHSRWHSPGLSYDALGRIFDAFGEFFLGRYAIGEAGGICYWPKSYTIDEGVNCYRNMPQCRGEIEAHQTYVDYLKKELAFERTKVAPGKLFNVESSILFARHGEAGIDGQCLEMLPGDPLITLSAIRGAAKAFGSVWGVHIAMLWYGGIRIDELWLKRWKQSLYLSYLAGADFIYPESGHMDYYVNGSPEYGFDTPEMRSVRSELRNLYRLSKTHERPACGPLTPFAIVQGKDDGHPGIWNPYSWGQYNNGREWESSDAEYSWEHFTEFFHKEDIYHGNVTGKVNRSGNPPCGQIDIIPPEADFSKYQTLFFLGVNKMDEQLYTLLIEFVQQGGHLVISLAHFDTALERGSNLQLFNNGDLSELAGFKVKSFAEGDVCGVKFIEQPDSGKYDFPVQTPERDPFFIGYLHGAEIDITDEANTKIIAGLSDNVFHSKADIAAKPLLIEHCLGKGAVYTVTASEHPGSCGAKAFTRCLLQTFVRGSRSKVDLLCSDTVRYSVYNADDGASVIYVLNSDVDLATVFKVHYCGNYSREIMLSANEFKVFYLIDGILLTGSSNEITLKKASAAQEWQFYGTSQEITLENISGSEQILQLNGSPVKLAANEKKLITVPENLLPGSEFFYHEEFLNEPELNEVDCTTPY